MPKFVSFLICLFIIATIFSEFLCIFYNFLLFFFFIFDNVLPHISLTKYFYLILMICTKLHGFKDFNLNII